VSISSHCPIPFPPVLGSHYLFVSMIYLFWKFEKWNGAICDFCDNLLSFNIQIFRLIHVVACIRTSFRIMVNMYKIKNIGFQKKMVH
jgi:hypothetical protein